MTRSVDWSAYARAYDLLASVNPAYQALVERFADFLSAVELPPRGAVLDLGAGTGSYSILAARRLSDRSVEHLDSDPQMNDIARRKGADAERRPRRYGFGRRPGSGTVGVGGCAHWS